jgi:2-hydroxychromene-2-carboxylate isomerase
MSDAENKGPIEFYFDFSSPYGYLAAQKIDQIGERYGRAVNWHPIMLGVILKQTGNAPNADIGLKSDYMRQDVPRLAEMMGAPFTWPEPFPVATLAAARGYYWLQEHDPEKAVPFAKAVYHHYFGKGVDISDIQDVVLIAEEMGIDGAALTEAVTRDDVKQRVKDKTSEAMDLGVFGSPYFLIDGEPFFGSDRLWQIERLLGKGKPEA